MSKSYSSKELTTCNHFYVKLRVIRSWRNKTNCIQDAWRWGDGTWNTALFPILKKVLQSDWKPLLPRTLLHWRLWHGGMHGVFLCALSHSPTKEVMSKISVEDMWIWLTAGVTLYHYCYRPVKCCHGRLLHDWPIGYGMVHRQWWRNWD